MAERASRRKGGATIRCATLDEGAERAWLFRRTRFRPESPRNGEDGPRDERRTGRREPNSRLGDVNQFRDPAKRRHCRDRGGSRRVALADMQHYAASKGAVETPTVGAVAG